MKHLTYLLNLTGLWTVAFALTGCTLLAPIPDQSRFFLLTPISPGGPGAQVNQGNTSALVLGLGPIKLPDYLQRDEIATRVEPNRLQFSENDHWAEPLKNNFIRVLSQNLSTLLGTQQIINFPWYSSIRIDYQIAITVDRFDCEAQGSGRLAALWSINDPTSGRILDRGNADLSAQCGTSVDQGVAGLSQALGDFSRQIATAVSQVSAAHRPR
jgi:uncharacterized lipoprotein YmbA